LDEASLILKARRGDNAAWAELMRRHQQSVFRLAYLLLGDAAEAEDAAQDCLIRAYRSLHRFDESRPLRPWLLRIVSNLASNRRRSLARYWAALQKAARAEPQSGSQMPHSSEAAEKAKNLWNAVERLPVRMQKVLYLRYFLELSVEETSAALALPEGTVKSQTHRALNRLQEIISRDFPFLEEGQSDR